MAKKAETTTISVAVEKPKPNVSVCVPKGTDGVELGDLKAGKTASFAIDGTVTRYSETADGACDFSIEPSAVKGGMVEQIKSMRKKRTMAHANGEAA